MPRRPRTDLPDQRCAVGLVHVPQGKLPPGRWHYYRERETLGGSKSPCCFGRRNDCSRHWRSAFVNAAPTEASPARRSATPLRKKADTGASAVHGRLSSERRLIVPRISANLQKPSHRCG